MSSNDKPRHWSLCIISRTFDKTLKTEFQSIKRKILFLILIISCRLNDKSSKQLELDFFKGIYTKIFTRQVASYCNCPVYTEPPEYWILILNIRPRFNYLRALHDLVITGHVCNNRFDYKIQILPTKVTFPRQRRNSSSAFLSNYCLCNSYSRGKSMEALMIRMRSLLKLSLKQWFASSWWKIISSQSDFRKCTTLVLSHIMSFQWFLTFFGNIVNDLKKYSCLNRAWSFTKIL